MLPTHEILKIEEYWMEGIQNGIYQSLKQYMKEKRCDEVQLAEQLKWPLEQLNEALRGDFKGSLEELVRLAIKINRVPKIDFMRIDHYQHQLEHGFDLVTSKQAAMILRISPDLLEILTKNKHLKSYSLDNLTYYKQSELNAAVIPIKYR